MLEFIYIIMNAGFILGFLLAMIAAYKLVNSKDSDINQQDSSLYQVKDGYTRKGETK